MLEILEFIFGSFWRWLGTFLLLSIVAEAVFGLIRIVRKGD